MYAHFSKFIRPGAVRVSSESAVAATARQSAIDHVAFVNDDGRRVVVLVNNGAEEQVVELQWRGWALDVVACKGCVVTVVWR